MRRTVALLVALALLAAGCVDMGRNTDDQREAAPDSGVGAVQPPPGDEAPSDDGAGTGGQREPESRDAADPEAFALKALTALAAGESLRRLPEEPGIRAGDLPLFQPLFLRQAAQAWEAAGLGAGDAPAPSTEPAAPQPLHAYARRYPFLDFAAARLLYLDRTGPQDRYAALLHVPPLGSFFYLTFGRDADGWAVGHVVETQLRTFRRSAEEDLRLVRLAREGRVAELERSLLVPYRYLVAAHRSSMAPARPASRVLEEASRVRAYQGQLWLDDRPFAFEWVLTPEGYRVVSATVDDTRFGELPGALTAVAPLPPETDLTEEAARATAARFIALWAEGRIADAEAMIPDRQRFYALSALSRSGQDHPFYPGGFWSLEAEKARLEHGFDLPAPVDWRRATVTEVIIGGDALPRVRIAFEGTPLVADLYLAGEGQVASVRLAYSRQPDHLNSLESPLLEDLPRLGDWERARRLLTALASRDREAAAAAAGLTPAELEALLAQRTTWSDQPPAPATPEAWMDRMAESAGDPPRVEPHPWGAGWRALPPYGVTLSVGELHAHLLFTGPDGQRQLVAMALGSHWQPTLPRDGFARPGRLPPSSLRPEAGFGFPLPAGDRLLLLQPVDEGGIAAQSVLRFYRGRAGHLEQVAALKPPAAEAGAVWHHPVWQVPGEPEWWVPYGPDGWDAPRTGIARIRWEEAGPRIVGELPAPEHPRGPYRDIDGDGQPEVVGVAHDAPAPPPVQVLWLADGQWQDRTYPRAEQMHGPGVDGLGSRVVWAEPGRLMAVPFDPAGGPGEPVPITAPIPGTLPDYPRLLQTAGDLVWWTTGGQLHWLTPDGVVTPQRGAAAPPGDPGTGRDPDAAAETVIATWEQDGAVVLTAGEDGLSLYTLDGALRWRRPFPYRPANTVLTDIDSDGQQELIAWVRHPADWRISRIAVLRLGASGYETLWMGPVLPEYWYVDLRVADLDGTPWKEILLVTNSGKGYLGFQVYSDSPTEWGPPVIDP